MTDSAPLQTRVEIQVQADPLPSAMRRGLLQFWAEIFQTSFDELDGVLAGGEAAANVDLVVVAMVGEVTAATCHLTMSRLDRRLGGLGEVATHVDCRGRGLAGALVGRAVAEFDRSGGTHLLLGTVNPAAARVYEAHGFRYLPGTRVMLRGSDQAGAFSKWFDATPATLPDIVPGGPEHRLTIIPPILEASDSVVLDTNIQLISTPTCRK